jgi:hypothetical protein
MTPHRRTGAAAQQGRNTECTEGGDLDGRQATAAPLPEAGLSETAEGVVRERVIPAGARSPTGPCDRRDADRHARAF